ncbi:PWWP domain-containing DNA repair factor 3A isoform X2 [Hyla sarda]|uniref:PWWP domain-containing DNA repair factor 3A isoform X2 n=1 Tax=Hyla sarda TaxID=327740 RepID=UPI0024C2720A|nr:PWWP domain-containing DNA repair factor 3A isoform X2 [Hyla sarda]
MWNNHLLPAKVLPRHKQLSTDCKLSAELFVVNKQIDVSLTDTKPFLMAEQKIRDVLERTKKAIISTEDRTHQRALDHTANKIRSSSFSPSLSTGDLKKRACEQKKTTVAQKGSKSLTPNTRQNKTKVRTKGNDEESKKKPNHFGTSISNEALETSDSDTRVAPRKHSTVQKNKKSPLNKRQDEALCGKKTVCDDVSTTIDQKSKKGSVGKSKGLDSPTVHTQKKEQKGTKQRPVQRRLRLSRKRLQQTNTDLEAESSETDTEKGNGHRVDKYMKHHMPDFEEEKGLSSSELSMEISSPECTALHAVSSSQDDTEEDIQLPVVVLQKEPAAIIPGSFVWCKFQQYPYWPSLVKLVNSKHKKATILFLEESISDPTKKKKSFKVALRSLKHYDCPEKQQLLENARKDFGKSIDWCNSLISDYRIRLGLPVRRELENGQREVFFPVLPSEVTEDQQEEVSVKSQTHRKLLPDRAQAARNRANEKLVTFIINSKEAENHLLDIIVGKKKSQWLKKFQSSNRRMNCLETYIEDEEQIEIVVGYLQTVCEKKRSATKKLMLGDQTQFIFEVLIPEAVIFAISATEQITYEKAEKKYLKGPSVTKRERKIFDQQILENKRLKLSLETKTKRDSKK